MGEIQKILFSDDVKSTMRKARLFGPGLQREAARIAKMHGASVTPVNYKSEASVRRKMKADGKRAHELKDTVRTTIIAPADKIRSVISDLEKLNSKGIKTSRIKEQRLNTGYSGTIVNVKSKKYGLTGEIQVNTPKMIYAKERFSDAVRILGIKRVNKETHTPPGWGHSLYEDQRTKTRGGGKEVWARTLSQGYYSKFREEY